MSFQPCKHFGCSLQSTGTVVHYPLLPILQKEDLRNGRRNARSQNIAPSSVPVQLYRSLFSPRMPKDNDN
jgi:hypothetical protein